MLTWEEHALVNDIGDRLLELYADRDDAISDGDTDRVHQLQTEIDEAKAERQKIIGSVLRS
jgi:hypothetical protein